MNILRWLCILPLAGSAAVMAQLSGEFRDPTRPAYASVDSGAVGVAPASRLTSIVRRKGSPSQAVIDGTLVPLGGKVGEAKLVHIHETSVVLQSERGSETLMLTPGIEKSHSHKPIAKKPVKTEQPARDSR